MIRIKLKNGIYIELDRNGFGKPLSEIMNTDINGFHVEDACPDKIKKVCSANNCYYCDTCGMFCGFYTAFKDFIKYIK